MFLCLMLALAGLAGLVACGGGSSTSSITTGGGGGGGGGGGSESPACLFNAPSGGGTTTGTGVGNTIDSRYFGMHLNSYNAPWPFYVAPDGSHPPLLFGAQRLWAAGVTWADIDTTPGTAGNWIVNPDWTLLDEWLADPTANSANVDFLYNLAREPTWASSQPNDTSCSNTAGGCDPPLDLNSDGSGSDDVWIAWVTALAQHSAAQKAAGLNGISFYEIWNEWNAQVYWNPTYSTTAQLVRMEQDARCVVEGPPPGLSCNPNSSFPAGTGIDPSAQIVSPSPVGAATQLGAVETNLETYFGTQVNGYGGGMFSDEIGFHGYVGTTTKVSSTAGPCPVPENVNFVIADLGNALAEYPEITNGKPLFNTEGSWSEADVEGFQDQDRQAAFAPRYLMLQQSGNISRMYWFAWDSKMESSLYNDTTGLSTLAAAAYAQTYDWTVGATVSKACSTTSSTSTVWTCEYTRSSPSGYKAVAVWDAGQDCTTTSCPTPTSFSFSGTNYIEYRDVLGNVTQLNGAATVQVGAQPILLETAPLPAQ
jgi:hypothetical protein